MELPEPLSVLEIPDLAADVPVGQPHNHPVFGCVVLVLVLHNQALSCKVVCFTLCTMKER